MNISLSYVMSLYDNDFEDSFDDDFEDEFGKL